MSSLGGYFCSCEVNKILRFIRQKNLREFKTGNIPYFRIKLWSMEAEYYNMVSNESRALICAIM